MRSPAPPGPWYAGRMNRPLRLLVAVLVLGRGAAGQPVAEAEAKSGAGAESAAEAQVRQRHHPMWVATKDGRTIHLLGSVHVTKEGMLPLPAVVEEALEGASAVMFETDIRQLTKPANQIRIAALTQYADGSTLADHLPDELLGDLKAYCRRKGVKPELFKSMKPWALAVSVIPMLELQAAGFDVGGGGIDGHLDKRARRLKKTVIALEDLAFYQNLFAALEADDQNAMLAQALKDAPETAKLANEMIEHWQNGNAEHLEALVKQGLGGHGKLEERLLYDRNEDWIPKILEASGEHRRLMLVVGAGHLVGERSVCELLGKQGWEIEQATSRARAEAE